MQWMASDRPYRRGLTASQIRNEIISLRGIQSDPVMLSRLMDSGEIDTILEMACESQDTVGPALSLMPTVDLHFRSSGEARVKRVGLT